MTSQRGGSKWWPVSAWEFAEVKRRLNEISRLPYGQRRPARSELAFTFGLSERTMLRWQAYDVMPVRCGKYEALFVIGKKRPSQVTPWEKAA